MGLAASAGRIVRRREPAGRELGARANSQLGVDAREVRLHGPNRDEQCRGHVLVGSSLRDQLRHAALGGRELVPARRPSADAAELGTSAVGPDAGADSLEELEGLLEGRPSVPALPSSPVRAAEGHQRAAALDRDGETIVVPEGFLE